MGFLTSASQSTIPVSSIQPLMSTITLEEHFLTPGFKAAIAKVMTIPPDMAATQKKLLDLGEHRLAAMDSGAVDMQVLSVAALGLDRLASNDTTILMHEANDQLASAVERHPRRFAGFANLNLRDPEAAAVELERCISELDFFGAMANGYSGGAFLDDRRFTPIWQTLDRLKVPLYLHPAPPPAAIFDTYYTGLPGNTGTVLSIAGWGWHVELGLHCLRLILSGLFDRYPDQQIIIGHMGEDLPYSLARAAAVLGPSATHLQRPIADYFHQNFHITTSGYFTQPPFLCALQVVGIDRLLYSVDYPFSPTTAGKAFLDACNLAPADFAKLTHQNAINLLHLTL